MAPADPMITAAPELRMRQDNAAFMGWVYNSTDSQYDAMTCNAQLSFYIGPTYVDCCPVTQTTCNPAYGCGAGTLLYTFPPAGNRTTTLSTAIPCTVQAGSSYPACGTAFFYEYQGAPNPKTEYFCDYTAYKMTFFRSKPSVAASTSSNKSSPSPSPSPNPNPSPSPSPVPQPPPPAKSKAWIAGAVVGPLLGLALIGALIFFLLGRRKKNRQSQQVGGATMAHNPSHPPAGVGGFTDNKPGAYASPPMSPGGQQQAPYNHNPHQSYGAPVSPVPPYASPQGYVPPHSPPPQMQQQPQQMYAGENKQPHVAQYNVPQQQPQGQPGMNQTHTGHDHQVPELG